MNAAATARRSPATGRQYLHSLAAFGMRPGLERVAALLARLGHPERSFRAIHVVGTNGKSSTTRYAAAVLAACGLRSGAYLSPHITGFNERVLVVGPAGGGGRPGAAVERVARRKPGGCRRSWGRSRSSRCSPWRPSPPCARQGSRRPPSRPVSAAVSTPPTCWPAPVVVLTTIGLEHTEVLGDTRELIFAEKAAVIGRGAAAVFGPLEGLEAAAERGLRARRRARPPSRPRRRWSPASRRAFRSSSPASASATSRCPARPRYQTVNAGLAVAACRLLLGGTRRRRRAPRAGGHGRPRPPADRRPRAAGRSRRRPQPCTACAALVEALAGLRAPGAARGRVRHHGRQGRRRDAGAARAAGRHGRLHAGERAAQPDGGAARPARGADVRRRGGRPRSGDAGSAPRWPAVREEPDPHAAVALARRLAGRRGSVLVAGSLYLLGDLADLLGGGEAGSGGVY